ncbi:hypothetical protein RFI_02779, partial [Reticulomyxa filosa]
MAETMDIVTSVVRDETSSEEEEEEAQIEPTPEAEEGNEDSEDDAIHPVKHTLIINNTTLVCPIELLFGAIQSKGTTPSTSLIPDSYDPDMPNGKQNKNKERKRTFHEMSTSLYANDNDQLSGSNKNNVGFVNMNDIPSAQRIGDAPPTKSKENQNPNSNNSSKKNAGSFNSSHSG